MKFYKEIKKSDNMGKNHAVYMELNGNSHYVCDIFDGSSDTEIAANELGLTLRSRLTRSKGKYAMLEGTIFNPERLLDAACEITGFKQEEFTDRDYKRGYTLLTVTADGCVNKYMVFDASLLKSLSSKIKARIK